jgi:asparagine synthetase B (glutamine-hydrolysing)
VNAIGKYIAKNTDFIVIFNGDVSEELHCSYIYAQFAPTKKEFEEENLRLLRNVYKYDVLRSARCMEHHGLEPRTPFADIKLVNYFLSTDVELRMFYKADSSSIWRLIDQEKAELEQQIQNSNFTEQEKEEKMQQFEEKIAKMLQTFFIW